MVNKCKKEYYLLIIVWGDCSGLVSYYYDCLVERMREESRAAKCGASRLSIASRASRRRPLSSSFFFFVRSRLSYEVISSVSCSRWRICVCTACRRDSSR